MAWKAEARVRGEFGKGLERLRAELRSLSSSGSPLQRAILERVGPRDKEQNVQAFASEGSTTGPAWRQLSPAYAARKRRRYPGRKILVATGEMRKAATNLGHPNRRVFFEGKVLGLGTNHELAAIHQHGAQGTVQMAAHNRRTRHGNGRVRGHKRALRIPARPLIRKTRGNLGQLEREIRAGIAQRVDAVVGKQLNTVVSRGGGALGAAAAAGRLSIRRR